MLEVHVPCTNRRLIYPFQLQGMIEGTGEDAREVREGDRLLPEHGQAAPGVKKDDGGSARLPDEQPSWPATKETATERGEARKTKR